MKKLYLFIVPAIFFMAGCAMNNPSPNIDKNFVQENSNYFYNGLVIASITQTGNISATPYYGFTKIGDTYSGQLMFNTKLAIDSWGALVRRIESDFQDVDGTLIVLELPAGEYHISSWVTPFENNTWITSPDGVDIKFNVSPAGITYIGELNMDLESRGLLGSGGYSVDINIKDSSERDLSKVKAEYPNLKLDKYKKILMVNRGTSEYEF